MLQQILGIVLRQLGIETQVNAAVQTIKADIEATASLYLQFFQTIQGEVEYIAALFGFGGGTNSLLEITDMLTVIEGNQAAILAAIGDVQLAAEPVTLPTTPPTGYGGSTGDIAATVWEHDLGSAHPGRAGDLLVSAGLYASYHAYSNTMARLGNSPMVGIRGVWDANQTVPYRPNFPYPDIRNILAGDTVLTFLNREDTVHTWAMADTGFAETDVQDENSSWQFVFLLSPQEFERLKGDAAAAVSLEPPVWPGTDLVTLGTAVALSEAVTVEGPMHGVIVSLSSVPSTRGRYVYDDLTAWLNIGALTFVDDHGEAESHQALNFTSQVYCPRLMAQAASCKVRVSAGVTGTVRPWLLTP